MVCSCLSYHCIYLNSHISVCFITCWNVSIQTKLKNIYILTHFYFRETLATVLSLIAFVIIVVIIINNLQTRKPNWLPPSMRTWEFLPKPLRSLEPYDNFMMKYILCCKKFKVKVAPITPLDV